MQALMIYSHNVATDFVKHKAREQSLEIYTLNDLSENIAYIIDDICPKVIVIGEETYQKCEDLFKSSLILAKHKAKVILLSKDEASNDLFDLTCPIPFDPSELIDQILIAGKN
jgi:hypothetical protein